ncbi:hypothetical protein Arub01_10200 [Actinomadura rubrobrunea]|uniref:Uncharacterized protein n=1 Tax=Actinomadura rubrobrunea TaxID=115335 RepID=A0A9W6USM0_9ACTN|nr:hypothetical protein Arub01_10200 [Actinomadura rubrobrunea]
MSKDLAGVDLPGVRPGVLHGLLSGDGEVRAGRRPERDAEGKEPRASSTLSPLPAPPGSKRVDSAAAKGPAAAPKG